MSTKQCIVEKKFFVLNLKNLDDSLLHQKHVDLLLGTKGFDPKHSIKVGEYIIQPLPNIAFVKFPQVK